jgi:hypothetical protein
MRTLIYIVSITVLTIIVGFLFPWWTIALVAIWIQLLLPLRPGKAFLCGFAGVFLAWSLVALYYDMNNGNILSERMAVLFGLMEGWLMPWVTGLIGGLVGGMSALTLALLRAPRKTA